MLAVAFKADITRVATLLGARDLTSRVYQFPKSPLFPDGGSSVSFHGGSHHQDDPVQIRRYAELNRYHVSTMAYLAQKLKAIPDGDGTLLDRHADPVRHEHGQLEPAPALRRAAHPGRRRERKAEGQPAPEVRAQDGDDRQPAGQRPGSVRDHQDKQGDSTGPLARLV